MRHPGISAVTLILLLAVFCCLAMSAQARGAAEETLTVVSPWKMKSMNLSKSGFIFARMGCLEMLTTTDNKGNLTGLLAKSWQVSPDKLTWTFFLRPDIYFHDKTPLTTKAAVKSLNISLENKGVLARARIAEITPLDSLTLQIRTTEPFSALPAHLAHFSAGIVSEASFDKDKNLRKVYGTGQYIFIKGNNRDKFSFRANNDYWGEKPLIKFTKYLAVGKGETRGFMMKAGQADMAFTPSPSVAGQLQTGSKAKVKTMIIPRTRHLLLNCDLPLFSDVRVRQALSLAIDRNIIASGLLRNPESAATQLLPPAVAMWHFDKLPPLQYDPGKARELLADAGWKPGPDGILEKDGHRFEFELVTYATRPMLPPLAEVLQQQFKAIGIKMDIMVGESSLIPDKRADGSLQAALLARNFGQIPDAIGTIYGDFGPNPGSWGSLGWQSDHLNRLLADYLQTFDQHKAASKRKEILALLQTELPVIPVTWYEHIVAVSNQLEGVSIDPFEIKSYVKGARWVK